MIKYFILVVVCIVITCSSQAQTNKRIVELSGLVLSRDTTVGPMPGVHVYIPKAGRGQVTNHAGYFSLPVLVSDSVVISMVGYKRQYYKVPNNASNFQTILIDMVEDTTYLKPIEIMAIPTEEMFKQAVLALDIPMNDQNFDNRNLNAELLALMIKTTPMDAAANYRNYINDWSSSTQTHFQPRTNPFLNPFNWARFIRDIRDPSGKKKKKAKTNY